MNIEELALLMVKKNQTLSTVESCTGGGIAATCTDIAGSSEWFLGGVVTYSNEMKIKLGVSEEKIRAFGAVSKDVVEQMAKSGLEFCSSDWSVAVSGIAGPSGGSAEKPVGTVWMAWVNESVSISEKRVFKGNRSQVRDQTIEHVLLKLVDLLK
jgi:nicotinamide-nucleotide amidase